MFLEKINIRKKLKKSSYGGKSRRGAGTREPLKLESRPLASLHPI